MATGTSPLWSNEFDNICSFNDDQVKATIENLLNEDQLHIVARELFSSRTKPNLNIPQPDLSSLSNIESIKAFQDWIEDNILPFIQNSYDNFLIEGLDNLDQNKNYLFISNHRDIVMDPLLLNFALKQNGFSTAHCAIGDNLLQSPIAADLARLNQCFKIIRSLKSPKAIFKAMKIQSAYIAYILKTEKANVWIAQKEGRSKDNVDKTNPALIKMLALCKSKDQSLSNYLNSLNIVPVSFSYEWDPCDVDKATQLVSETTGEYIKSSEEDVLAVKKGLMDYKGEVAVTFGSPISISDDDHRLVAQEIDDFITKNRRVYPVNCAAFKKLNGETHIDCRHNKSAINKAAISLEERLENADAEIKKRVLSAYAAALT